jgi:RES domain-containing protein
MEALYTSRRFQTAWLEAQQGFPFKAQPMTLVAYAVDCEDVLDLRDAATLSHWNIDPRDLDCAWERLVGQGSEPPTWTMARRLHAAGQAGIIVPSYARGATGDDVNVVFWRWSKDLPHQVRIVDDFGRLPKDRSSWH